MMAKWDDWGTPVSMPCFGRHAIRPINPCLVLFLQNGWKSRQFVEVSVECFENSGAELTFVNTPHSKLLLDHEYHNNCALPEATVDDACDDSASDDEW